MGIKEKEYKMIDRFFEMDLDRSELEAFEQKYDSDEDFREAVDQYETAHLTSQEAFIPGYGRFLDQKKEGFAQHLKKPTEERTPTKGIPPRGIGIGILIFLVLGTLAYWWYTEGGHQDKSMKDPVAFAENMAVNSINMDGLDLSSVRSAMDVPGNAILTQFEQKKYEEVILATQDAQTPELNLLRGLAFVQLGQKKEAIKVFEPLSQKQSNLKDAALWWLVYLNLDAGKDKEVDKYLNAIIEEDFPSTEEALELLKRD